MDELSREQIEGVRDELMATNTLRVTRTEIDALADMALAYLDAKADAQRYVWAAENCVIEGDGWRHDGKDPASTKQPLDNRIDQARGAANGQD